MMESTEPKPDVWCIQVIHGPDREVLHETWVHVHKDSNAGYKFPRHGAKAPSWDKIFPGAKYHLTPFTMLDRRKYLSRGKIRGHQ